MCRSSMIDDRTQPRRSKLDRLPSGLGAVAAAVIAAGLVVGGIVTLRDPVPPTRYIVDIRGARTDAGTTANLAHELARCRTVTEASADADCHAAWEAHRRNFFGTSKEQDR
jgi:conjugative transfer region protein TrbK